MSCYLCFATKIKTDMKNIFTIVILLSLFLSGSAQQQTLTNDGAWCWFSAPRAIYRHAGQPEIVTGWVTQDGSIQSAILNIKTGKTSIQTVSPQLDKDDHANPAFVELKNGHVLMAYTKHFDKYVRFYNLPKDAKGADFKNLGQVAVFNEAQFKLYPRKGVTYANPVQLKKEKGRIFTFGRWTGYKPNLMWSDDNGKSFNDAQVFITNKPFNDIN